MFTSGSRYLDKAAMSAPITIEGLSQQFCMQFDLGARTIIYGNSIEPYLKKNKLLREKLDTTYTFTFDGKDALLFRNLNLQWGEVGFNEINVIYFKNYGYVQKKFLGYFIERLGYSFKPFKIIFTKSKSVHIGTMGADLFQDKILVIDYLNTRLAVTDNLPVEYENLPCEKFELDEINRIKIPFHINGKEERLMFDTGSSRTQLITTKERALEISDSIVVDSETGTAWGDPITTVHLKVNKPVEFAGKVLENSTVEYIKNNSEFDAFYKNENIWGVTGNAFFWNNVVIIDYKNKTFRVK
jgi:hypothetical protein